MFLAACGTADARGVVPLEGWRFDAPNECVSPEPGDGGAIVASIHYHSYDGLMGAVSRDTEQAPHRNVEVSVLKAANTTVFLFSGYLPDDSTIAGTHIPRAITEHLVEGQTVIAHVVNVGGLTRLFLHDAIDFKTNAHPHIAHDGSSPCKE